MHASRRVRLVSYDIRDPKRWRAAHKLVQGYGERVQLSLFRCRLDDRQTAQLRAELAAILAEIDDLLVISLCDSCAGQVVSRIRAEDWDAPPPSFAVVRAPSLRGRE